MGESNQQKPEFYDWEACFFKELTSLYREYINDISSKPDSELQLAMNFESFVIDVYNNKTSLVEQMTP